MSETGTAVALEPVKSNHRVNVVRIKEVLKHPNADKLEIYPIDGTDYQYIGPIGQFKVGDLAAYIQPDSVVPDKPEYASCGKVEFSKVRFPNDTAEFEPRNLEKSGQRDCWFLWSTKKSPIVGWFQKA